jgi:hypothetical protein
VVTSSLDLKRSQILAYRRTVQALDDRLPPGPDSLRRAAWAGLQDSVPRSALHSIHARVEAGSLTPVRTPIGDSWILTSDEPMLRAPAGPTATGRLLPSGDPYFVLQGPDRELLVPGATHRAMLWPPRVWPGAVLVDGEIVGTWRRVGAALTIQPWRRLSAERDAVEAEAMALPLPEVHGPIVVRWVAGPG